MEIGLAVLLCALIWHGFTSVVFAWNLKIFRALPADMPKSTPKISVLVPARNEELSIGTCVASLLDQDYPNYELLVLDDQSTDATAERLSAFANGLARRLTGVALTDPMSGYFLLPAATARALVPRLSGIGFKILLDLLATSDTTMTVKEFPLNFAARREGESKLDRAILFDFLAGLYDKTLGKVIPTRFALFGTVGALGVVVHFAVLTALLFAFGERFAIAQTAAVLVAMSFNFWLNNWLTYRDKRLTGVSALLRGWLGFIATCAIGAFANVAIATFLEGQGVFWAAAALAGIVVGSVWNYALSSRFVWGRF
jgi:dolichol-phosphate mannosyltransferase